jgi:Tfp pilus assembly protein PilN
MIYVRNSVGVEIRGQDLVVSCLQSNLSAAAFTHFRRISQYRQRDHAEVRKDLDRFFHDSRANRENVVLGLPRGDVVVRYLDLPSEVSDNLKQVVSYQVQSYEPTEEEKYYYDFAALRQGEGSKRIQVLLVMVKRAILDGHLLSLKSIGMRPASVTVGSFGLATLFLQSQKGTNGSTAMLMDLAPDRIEVLALRGSRLLHTHEAGKAPEAGWRDVLIRELEVAAEAVKMGPEDSIDHLILAGEPAAAAREELREAIPDCELVGKHLRLEVPVQNLSHLQEAASSVGLAFGGLVRRPAIKLNLLPTEMRFRQTRWAYIPSLILGAIILILLGALALRGTVQERYLVRKLQRETDVLRGRVESVQRLRTEMKRLEAETKYNQDLVQRRDMNLEALRELTAILPSDTFLTVYSNKDGTIQISGSSTAAPDLIPKLEKSPLFKDVQQRGQVFRDAQTGKDRFIFEMKLEK